MISTRISPLTPLLLLLCFSCCTTVDSFQLSCRSTRRSGTERLFTTEKKDDESGVLTGDVASTATSSPGGSMILECAVSDENEALKQELLKLAASFDRGFGASPAAREQAQKLVEALEASNNATAVAATILDGAKSRPTLSGKWRMIWTTAVDVLSLQASPLFTTGAIHQVFDSETKVVTNVIDFLPRVQSLLPPQVIPNSLFRAKVKTRACKSTRGSGNNAYPNRVGLIFESVAVQPLQVLGIESTMLPPLAFDLPKLPGTGSSTEESSSPGYFDVTYIDDELLIIRQNAPGGLFALVRVDSIDK